MRGNVYLSDGCRAVAKAQREHATYARSNGDERIAKWHESWAQWYEDRADGKPGDDVLPEPPR